MKYYENEITELKSRVTPDICKEVIAFANTKGGTIYIGIADHGEILGVEDPDSVILKISNQIRDAIKPDITMFIGYEILSIDDKKVLSVIVRKGTDRPYYLSSKGLRPSGVYVRNGTSADPATDTAIRKMIKETDGDSYETTRSLEQDLTFQAAEEQFRKRNVALDLNKMQTLGLISSDGMYSNTGLLLSDQCSHTIKAAVWSGLDKTTFQDRREFEGSLFRQMEEVYAYLDMHNQTKATFDGLYRTDIRDYPEEALREALLNSIVHRDYSFSASTLINIYEDRIEFVSIGGLPSGILIEDILLGLSVCRNPQLAAIFYRLSLIEAYGTGIQKIMNSYRGTGLEPKIEVSSNAFKITLPNRNHSGSAVFDTAFLTPEERILDLLNETGSLVRSDVDRLLDVSQATANRILRRMLHQGLILQDGDGKNTRYRKRPYN